MGRKAVFAIVCLALLAGGAAGQVRADAPEIEQCPGGTCGSRHCRACCPAGKSPTCSWWSCKCQTDSIAAASVGVGSIIDP